MILIDTQFEKNSRFLNQAIRKISKQKIDFVINTHWHGDHSDGNKYFSRSAHVVAHENVRKRLSEDQFNEFFDRKTKALPKKALPILSLSGTGLSFMLEMKRWRYGIFLQDIPTETPLFSSKMQKLLTWETIFFSNRFPFIDLSSGGSVLGYRDNVKKLLKMIPKDYKIIPGHGELADYNDLKNFSEMLGDSIDRIRDLKNLEKPLDEILGMPLLEKYEEWGKGFVTKEKWIKIIHQGLK